MHAFLVSGGTSETRRNKAIGISQSVNSKLIMFEIKKISDVRELEKLTRLTLREKTSFLLRSIDKASEESQNALLKTLEEPQTNALFILTAEREQLVIPTIVSRCERIHLVNIIEADSKTESFLEISVGEKLNQTSKITDRTEALEFTKQLLYQIHNKLIGNDNKRDSAHNLQITNNTYQNVLKNGNVALQLTNLCIQLK